MIKAKGPTGFCPVCRRECALLKDGRIGRHGTRDKQMWPPQDCPGWGQPALPR